MAKRTSCHGCVYAHVDKCLWMRSLGTGWAAWPTCGNQPDSYGRTREGEEGGRVFIIHYCITDPEGVD